ncbi:hypothetical protein AOC05_18175 [Arthrobacter alpinus]|uniref:Ribbon-helix-helix protein CopG domain-containing protein n=1 Tax=Arthrobacter alpinus TaxID=656366 RepID=A0A0M4RS46_9MICC|nr:hypothetical protein [Arthrobacter alpinus]ALE93801.1 hypothetical protein AOC05_18175 [Arthrobacter alpinus]
MTKKDASELNAEEEARYQQMADWAENGLPQAKPSGIVRRGSEAAAHGRSILLEAGMDPAELDRLIGGRPNLDPDAKPGKHSPHLNLRVTEDLKQQLKDLAAERQINSSDLVREILTAGVHQMQQSRKREKHPA